MPLQWLGDMFNLSPPKHPLDEYQPKVAHPQTAQDWIANIGWLKEWLASVFTNVLKLDPDIMQESKPAGLLGEAYQTYRTRSALEEARVCLRGFCCPPSLERSLRATLTLRAALLSVAEARICHTRRTHRGAAGPWLAGPAVYSHRDGVAHSAKLFPRDKGNAVPPRRPHA